MLLLEFFEQCYTRLNDLDSSTEEVNRRIIRGLYLWAGKPIALSELSPKLFNDWLHDRKNSGRAPHTIASQAALIKAIWRRAAEAGLSQRFESRELRRVKTPEVLHHGWTFEEITQKLLPACKSKRRFQHALGCRGCDWWELYIRLAWDTGFRADQLVNYLRRDAIIGCRACVIQVKSRRMHSRPLADSTLALLDAFLPRERTFVLPSSCTRRNLSQQFKGIVREVGLTGSLKTLRKSSGSAVEKVFPGFGHRHLGNTQKVFDANYRIHSIADSFCPSPPELKLA